ncbi:MAG TPA: protein kinase, partial [Vicinamibacteria bacterium]|nr:protein kinase [Vicinamibacteria bacterium]
MANPRSDDTIANGPPSPEALAGLGVERPRIGKYEIVGLRGRGGMGVVHQAWDPSLEREVALKVMLPQIAEHPEHKQRFEREARAVARLTHPNVVTLYDLGYHTDGSPYIVMELLRGRDLLAALQEVPPLPITGRIAIVLQVLDGLGHAHKVGIVHRDIKPANIFLTEDGTAKIMDFGIARFTTAAGTGTGAIVGTPSYMSPEQVRGEKVDGLSDLFSVGCMLYELLTGRRPFDGENVMATLYQIANGTVEVDLPPGPAFAPLLPVVRRATARKPENRFATAGEFAAALRSCLEPRASGRPDVAAVPAGSPLDLRGRSTPILPPPGAGPAGPTTRRVHVGRLFELLREAYVGRRSGHLHFTVGTSRKSLRIRAGQIIDGTSDTANEHLGDVLVRYGLLSQAGLERAVSKVLGERRRLGEVLTEQGVLDRTRIAEAVGLHVREILFSVLETSQASYVFEEIAESSLEADIVCPLSTGEVILEATRRVQDPELVRGALGEAGRVLVLSSNPLLRAQTIALSPIDGFVLSRIDGATSAREVASLVSLPSEDVERSLFGLLCTGIVDFRAEKPAPRVQAAKSNEHRSATTNAPAPPRAAPAPSTPTPSPASSEAASKWRVEDVRRLILDGMTRLKRDHFEVLGIERTATEAQVKEAYSNIVRVLHPDACRHPDLANLSRERDLVFGRLTEACETLRDPEARARYERAFDPRRQAPKVVAPPPAPSLPPVPQPVAVPPVVEDRTPTPPPPVSDDILDRARDLLKSEKYWDLIQLVEPAVPRASDVLQI